MNEYVFFDYECDETIVNGKTILIGETTKNKYIAMKDVKINHGNNNCWSEFESPYCIIVVDNVPVEYGFETGLIFPLKNMVDVVRYFKGLIRKNKIFEIIEYDNKYGLIKYGIVAPYLDKLHQK